MNIPYCFSTGHHINDTVVKAFAKGCGGKVVKHCGKTIFSYGLKRGTIPCYQQAEEFWYCDKGYYKPSNHPHSFDGYYRVVKNGLIHSGEGNFPRDRFDQFKFDLKPCKPSGVHIIFCPILSVPAQFYGIEVDKWTREIYTKIGQYTDRPIIVSTKSNGFNAKHFFKNAHCLVTFNSNIMVDALIEGVPIISLSPDRLLGSIETLESPFFDQQILFNLAYHQWSLDEMRSGKCWRELNETN